MRNPPTLGGSIVERAGAMSSSLIVSVAAALCAAAVMLGGTVSLAAELISAGPFVFEFATVEEADRILSSEDSFIAAMSPFDRQVRMKTEEDKGKQAFLEFAAEAAEPWSASERAAVTAAIEALAPALSKIERLPVTTIQLIHTSGEEESGAAYTRGTAIILPEGETGTAERPRTRLLAHELFHVLSRADPELRDRLYRTIGFRRTGTIELPADQRARKITNPDAPVVMHVIDVKLSDQKTITVAPVTFAATAYDVDTRSSLFSYLQFKLMEVVPIVGERHSAKVQGGEAVMHEPTLPDFHRQIGRNTGYILHPDEILADNFALLVTGETERIPDRWVTDAIAEALFADRK